MKEESKTKPTVKEEKKEEIFVKKDEGLNQAKIEYDRLISFFKYLLGIVVGAITIVVAVVVSFTYKDASEYRKELKEREEKLENRFKEDRESMKTEMKGLKEDYKEKLKLTQNEAIAQIGSIRNDAVQTAKSAANEKIEETFKNGNINALVIDVAKKYMEPEVTRMILEERDKKIDDAIAKMETGDVYDGNAGSLVLNTNLQYGFNKEQIDKLINLYKSKKNVAMNGYVCSALLREKNNKEVVQFFEYILNYEKEDLESRDIAIGFILTSKIRTNFNFFLETIRMAQDKYQIFMTYAKYSAQSSTFSPLEFLDSKEIVDLGLKDLKGDQLKSVGQVVLDYVKSKLSESEIKKTYFYQKINQ